MHAIPDVGCRAAVLVEGASDQQAVHALAERRGRDLARDGVVVVPMGGATNISHYLSAIGGRGAAVTVAGLYDAAEEGYFRRGLERAGVGPLATRSAIEEAGFFACVDDLEDELIRALGTEAVVAIVEAQGELPAFRILQKQPAQQVRSLEDQLRRFMGTRSGRKIRYGRLLVEALDLARVPRALDGVLDRV
jgi:hypothetical protein